MLYRRSLMIPKSSSPAPVIQTASFSVLLNFQDNNNKNIMQLNPTSNGYNPNSYGIGFCFYASPIETTTPTSCVIKITTPSNNVYTYTSDDILLDTYNLIDGYLGKSVCVFVNISKGNEQTNPDLSNLYFSPDPSYYSAETTSMGAVPSNMVSGQSPNLSMIQCPSSSNQFAMNYQYQLRSICNVEDGDYRFDITLEGELPNSITVSNVGYISSTTIDKNTYYASSSNRSKVQWISGDDIFVDNMFKANGSV